MSMVTNVRALGRRLFGATKRPLWEAAHALTGARLQATTEYLDFGWYSGLFEARSHAVQLRLPPRFTIVEDRPGWTDLQVFFAEYRRMDILQPYQEIGVLAPVRFTMDDGNAIDGQYVMHMQVTSEEARWTGVENYGFPKVVADIRVVDEDACVSCTAYQGGIHVLTMRVDRAPTQRFEHAEALLNVRVDGTVTRCKFAMDGDRNVSATVGGVTLELGSHALADQLRDIDLRLDSGRGLYAPHAHALLSRAQELGPLHARKPAATARTEMPSHAVGT